MISPPVEPFTGSVSRSCAGKGSGPGCRPAVAGHLLKSTGGRAGKAHVVIESRRGKVRNTLFYKVFLGLNKMRGNNGRQVD